MKAKTVKVPRGAKVKKTAHGFCVKEKGSKKK